MEDTPSLLPWSGSRLVDRAHPRSLDEFVGQPHLLEAGRPLGEAFRLERMHSFIAWGPPGSGKSALARLAAERLPGAAHTTSGAVAGAEELARALRGDVKVLVVDEAHRLSPAAQDVLLHHVDAGLLLLATAAVAPPGVIGAPLLSRLAVYRFHPLDLDALRQILARVLGSLLAVDLQAPAEEYLLTCAAGDARVMLDALDRMAAGVEPGAPVTLEDAMRCLQPDQAAYVGGGVNHHDVVTAFVKSMRGSDPDAATYWLAVMLEAAEEPGFIARRIAVVAAEDVGLADPFALVLAESVLSATDRLSPTEARMLLAHAAVYVACAPKSGAVARGLARAQNDLRLRGPQSVPLHLRQRTLRGTPEPDYSQGSPFGQARGPVLYPQYLPDTLKKEVFYTPGEAAGEARIRERLRAWWPDRY